MKKSGTVVGGAPAGWPQGEPKRARSTRFASGGGLQAPQEVQQVLFRGIRQVIEVSNDPVGLRRRCGVPASATPVGASIVRCRGCSVGTGATTAGVQLN